MTAERLIARASEHAAKIAPCGPEVLFGIGWAEAAQQIGEIERYVSGLPADERCAFLKKRLLLAIPGDDGEAMGPWQCHMRYMVDAWTYWDREIKDRSYQPEFSTLEGQTCGVACYLGAYHKVGLPGVLGLTEIEAFAALHHYGCKWKKRLPEEIEWDEWCQHRNRYWKGLERYAQISAELTNE